MLVNGSPFRTIWLDDDGRRVRIIDQTRLPHEFVVRTLATVGDACVAIRDMQVRGAPLIGATAAYGMCLAAHGDPSDAALDSAVDALLATRPTAANLRWALDRMRTALDDVAQDDRIACAYALAAQICDEDVEACRTIGVHGDSVLRDLASRKNTPLNILTHCNAGWLATVDWGTALAPIYHAHDAGITLHVWVDETRPRNQGAALTAWELAAHGVPHTVIVDNAGGHLMQHGHVDVCITGTDRTTATGDVCNKIGTYLKALAAHDNGIPFYVAAPSSSIDWAIRDGLRDVPIEERDGCEVSRITGCAADGATTTVQLTPAGCPTANPAFDVTPARLVTGLITERGLCDATEAGLAALFPEHVVGTGA
ncbi:MAG: S-methyl-5-thioribose-1-phosphate isomerase [Planctomycetes bacterium]|nr:S-methyl-5-thioribose-1-phosphate isomerase [Planctomycetota bacterium]